MYTDDEFREGLKEQPGDNTDNAVEKMRRKYYGAKRCPKCGLKMITGKCNLCKKE
jgi:hypothetical protein